MATYIKGKNMTNKVLYDFEENCVVEGLVSFTEETGIAEIIAIHKSGYSESFLTKFTNARIIDIQDLDQSRTFFQPKVFLWNV